MLTSSTAGAMNVVDAEPLDGVDFKNGVLAYITLVCCLASSMPFDRHTDQASRPSTRLPSRTVLLSPEVSVSQRAMAIRSPGTDSLQAVSRSTPHRLDHSEPWVTEMPRYNIAEISFKSRQVNVAFLASTLNVNWLISS